MPHRREHPWRSETSGAARHERAEILCILEWEVAPVVGANLFNIAGEWAGFDEAWLVERVQASRRSVSFFAWFGGWISPAFVRGDLSRIERESGALPS